MYDALRLICLGGSQKSNNYTEPGVLDSFSFYLLQTPYGVTHLNKLWWWPTLGLAADPPGNE